MTIPKRPLSTDPPTPPRRRRRVDPGTAPLSAAPFRFTALLVSVAFVACGAVLIRQGVVEAKPVREEYAKILDRRESRTPPRGEILARDGTPLAESVITYDCWAIAKDIDKRVVNELSEMLASVTDTPATEFQTHLQTNHPRLSLFRDLELEQYSRLRHWRYVGWYRQANRFGASEEGKALIRSAFGGDKALWYKTISRAVGNIEVQPVHRRRYPLGHVAGQLVGFVTERQEGLTPGGGIELWNDTALAGEAQSIPLRDVTAAQIGAEWVLGKPALGIRLTIDPDLQAFVEQSLAAGQLRTRSHAGVAVVMDSQSGDILAAANVPVFDPELYQRLLQPQLFAPSELEPHRAEDALPTVLTVDNLPLSTEPTQPTDTSQATTTSDGIALSATQPATEGRPLLLDRWPLADSALTHWAGEVPPALIPGTSEMHQRNGVLGWQVEPGSIFKPFAMLSALEHGAISPDTTFVIGPAPFTVPKLGIRVGDHKPPPSNEVWTAHKVMVKSSNKGMAQIALKSGQASFVETFHKLHFAEALLDVPGEAGGSFFPDRKWYPSELVTMSFGQGLITTTPLQLTAGMNAIATGSWIRPRLIAAVQEPTGTWREFPTATHEATLDPQAVRAVQLMLEDVVREGTGTRAAVAGFPVAGKTGTAWKAVNGSYESRRYISSFLGYGPTEAPRYTVLVMYDDPQLDRYGGLAAAPVFGEIMDWLHRRELRDPQQHQPVESSQATPVATHVVPNS